MPPLGQQRPQLVVDRVVEVAAAAPAADRDAGQPEVVQRAAGLLGGARPAQRHRAEPEQPVRRVGHVGGQLVVALGHDPGGEPLVVRSGAEQERRHRHRVPRERRCRPSRTAGRPRRTASGPAAAGPSGPTPLTRGSSRTMPSGTPARSASPRSASRSSSGSGMACACTSSAPPSGAVTATGLAPLEPLIPIGRPLVRRTDLVSMRPLSRLARPGAAPLTGRKAPGTGSRPAASNLPTR